MTENKRGGRPQKEIDRKQFENLCGLQCTKEEICHWFDTTDKTLESWWKPFCESPFADIETLNFSILIRKEIRDGNIKGAKELLEMVEFGNDVRCKSCQQGVQQKSLTKKRLPI